MYTYENHLLVRTEHQEPGSSRDGMVETRTYYPSGKQESVTQIFADDTGHTTVYDEHDRQIASIRTVGGEVTYRSDITYVPWDENAKGSDNMRYVSVQSVSYTEQAALGTTEGYLSTETYDEHGWKTESLVTQLDGLPIRRLTRTYYENGQVATECLEQYIEGTRSYTTYDESGNQTGYEYTEQTGN